MSIIAEFISINQDTITLIVGATAGYLISWLKGKQAIREIKNNTKTNREKSKQYLIRAREVSKESAEAAEQKFKNIQGCGEEKTRYAIEYTRELLKIEDIDLSDTILDGMIQKEIYNVDETTSLMKHVDTANSGNVQSIFGS